MGRDVYGRWGRLHCLQPRAALWLLQLRRVHRLQGGVQHGRDVFSEDERHATAKLRRDVFHQVLAVTLRQDDCLDPRPLCRQHLFFDAADGKHLARCRYYVSVAFFCAETGAKALGDLRERDFAGFFCS